MANCRRAHDMARKVMLCALAIILLLAVFALYTRPDFLMTVADQVWSCF